MWYLCVAPFALAALAQIFFLGAILDDFDEVPGLQANWTRAFFPSIIYLVFAATAILTRFWRAAYNTGKSRQPSGEDDLPADVYRSTATRTKSIATYRNIAWVTFVDTCFDLALFIAGVVFIVLLIDTLEIAQSEGIDDVGTDMADSYSFIGTSIPLVVIWVLLSVSAVLSACRTRHDYNSSRRVEPPGLAKSKPYGLSNTNGDDEDDKNSFIADSNYQQWPCAFMFTWSLGYGWPDTVLSILLFVLLLAMIPVTLMLANFLDTGSPSITAISVLLWIIEGLVLVFAVLATIWMSCCSCMPLKQPRGRFGYCAKAVELLVIVFVILLLIVQQILIAVRVDDEDAIDWNVVFIPLYVLLTLAAFAGCSFGFCVSKAPQYRAKHPCTNEYDADISTEPPLTSAWGLVGK
jgi:hypothetical protein